MTLSEQNVSATSGAGPKGQPELKRHAVTLYAIIFFKIAKGVAFLILALFIYEQADNNVSQKFSVNDVRDLPILVSRWRRQVDPVSALLWTKLTKSQQTLLAGYHTSSAGSNETKAIVVQALNEAVEGDSIYDPTRFKGFALRPETLGLLKDDPTGPRLERLNRWLLEDAYPIELSRNHSNLPQEYEKVMNAPVTAWLFRNLRIHPESQFFINVADTIANLTATKVHRVALGCVLLSLFPLVEGIGMLFRVSWAGWLAIGESAFFVPIEVHTLLNPETRSSLSLWVVTIINIIIVVYLFLNRDVLFHHHVPRDKSTT